MSRVANTFRDEAIEEPSPGLRERATAVRDRVRFFVVRPDWPKVTGRADAVLFGTLLALITLGVVMVYSASSVRAVRLYDNGNYFLIRQALYASVGIPMMVMLAKVDYHRYRALTYPALIGVLGLMLVVVMGLGRQAGGASRWIQVGPVNVQPAELAKVVLIMWLADSLSRKAGRIRSFKIGFLPHVLMAGLLTLLCMRQPDFGSAVMMTLMTFVLLFTAGAKLAYMLAGAAIALPAAYLLVRSTPYRWARIIAFTDPMKYRMTGGYQIVESWMSFGAGGLTGVGLGDSRQKMMFLPEAHTDFIAAIIGEELGFIGLCAVVIAFVVVVARGVRAALRAVDDYGTYLAVGITLFIGFQAFTNLAVVLGLLPTKGLTLPFLSFGGSSLLVNCGAAGILLNVSRERELGPEPVPENTPRGASGGKSRKKSKKNTNRAARERGRTGA